MERSSRLVIMRDEHWGVGCLHQLSQSWKCLDVKEPEGIATQKHRCRVPRIDHRTLRISRVKAQLWRCWNAETLPA